MEVIHKATHAAFISISQARTWERGTERLILEGAHGDSLVQIPCVKAGAATAGCPAVPGWVVAVSKDEDPTASEDSL